MKNENCSGRFYCDDYHKDHCDGCGANKNATVKTNFTAEELREAVARVDVMLRPYAVVCNPINADIIEKELGKQFKVLATPVCEEGVAYLIDRKQFDILTQIKPLEAFPYD